MSVVSGRKDYQVAFVGVQRLMRLRREWTKK